MTMSQSELRSAIEAILFVSGEPVRIEDLIEAFGDEGREAVELQLQELSKRYQEFEGGFYLEQTAGGYRLATRPEFDPFLRKYFSKKGEGRLSMAALETMSIIAYRQPVTAPEISEIRGVNTSGVIRTLLERKMIRIAGRKNVVGSPFLYRTTKEFLVHFGLNTLQDLPRLEEFAELLGENVNEELVAVEGDLAGVYEGTQTEAEAAQSAEFASPETREADEAREVSDDDHVAANDSALSEVLSDDVATEDEPLRETMQESESEREEQSGAEDAGAEERGASDEEVTAD
jgi:segregation and condensation protein B